MMHLLGGHVCRAPEREYEKIYSTSFTLGIKKQMEINDRKARMYR